MTKEHTYKSRIKWTGNNGQGTTDYRSYERSYDILIENKVTILGTSDPSFRGDMAKHNPEELFLSSISSCHMLWYLHLCAVNHVIVIDYDDNATAIMTEDNDGSGKFKEIVLNPIVTVTDTSMVEKANELHQQANSKCFIANTLNIPVIHKPTTKVKGVNIEKQTHNP